MARVATVTALGDGRMNAAHEKVFIGRSMGIVTLGAVYFAEFRTEVFGDEFLAGQVVAHPAELACRNRDQEGFSVRGVRGMTGRAVAFFHRRMHVGQVILSVVAGIAKIGDRFFQEYFAAVTAVRVVTVKTSLAVPGGRVNRLSFKDIFMARQAKTGRRLLQQVLASPSMRGVASGAHALFYGKVQVLFLDDGGMTIPTKFYLTGF